MERDNAVTFCDAIKHAHDKVLNQIDAYKIEDAQFDLLIGKPVADENMRQVLSDASTSSESKVYQATNDE